jgi:hypothetical protein
VGRRPAVGNTLAGWGSLFFSMGWQVTRVPPYVRRPFPSKENRQISERDDLGPAVVPGGQEIGLGSRNLRPQGKSPGRRHVPRGAPPAKAGHMAKRRVGV